MLSGGRKTEMELSEKLDKVLKNTESEVSLGDDDIQIRGNFNKDLSENGTKSVIEFQASSYAVLENEQICRITIERYGKLDQEVTFRYKLRFFKQKVKMACAIVKNIIFKSIYSSHLNIFNKTMDISYCFKN